MLDDDDYDDELDAFGVLAAQNAQDARDAQMASASPLAPERANPKRAIEDTLDPPPIGWTMPRPILMKDGADAAGTAIEQVWPAAADSDPMMVAMCNIHIQRVIKKARGDLRDANNHTWMMNDVNNLKECVPAHAKEFAFEYRKGEGIYADKFEHWMDIPWTRAELNQHGYRGLPPDNNGLEGKNGAQKGDRGHKREHAVMYCVSNRKWMQLESTLDLRFGRHFRADVWSIKFFQGVAAGAELVKTPILSVATKFGKYAPGALVIPSSETVNSLAVKHQIRTPHAVKIAIVEPEEGAAESWVKTFQWLWLPKTQRDPAILSEWDYDTIIHWYRAFHVLIPIPAGDKYAEETIATMRYGNATIDQAAYEQKGIMACTCPTYLHYCNCDHACAWLVANGIMTAYPPTLDPGQIGGGEENAEAANKKRPKTMRDIASAKPTVRVANAIRGGALGNRTDRR
ncbi:hypothetical protein T492DRAFT_1056528 [Pavlovales sp. CCMP2436]|nr:hypothetical protein T492DRAFT_1056528 [Pavlovales sp. CCMP2436]